jgi:hypothetical protein
MEGKIDGRKSQRLTPRPRGCAALLVLVLAVLACGRVAAEQVPGRYEASYPFGKETLTLMSDGQFVQEVAISGEDPVKVTGSWKFDAAEGRINLDGAMVVVDGFGVRRQGWRTPGLVSSDIERLPSGFLIGSARAHPYVKK